MAVLEQVRFKRITTSGGGTLPAPDHEAYRLVNVFCNPSTNDSYLSLSVDGVNVLKLRVKGKSGNHCPYPGLQLSAAYERRLGTLFDIARAAGFPLDVPIPAGQTLTVARYAETGDVTLVYSVHDPADVRDTEPNGARSTVRRYPHYCTNSAAITATPTTLDTSLCATFCDAWPIGDVQVPTGRQFVLWGLAAAPAAHGNASANKGYTNYVELWKDGDVLLTDGVVGLPLGGLSTQTADACVYTGVAAAFGPATDAQPTPPLILAAPLVFKAGDKLTPKLSYTNAAAGGLVAADIDAGSLLEPRRAASRASSTLTWPGRVPANAGTRPTQGTFLESVL